MKKAELIFSTFLIIIFFFPPLSSSDQNIVCIDPGHGGRGADKFHNGGDGHGGAGPVLGIAEQWVNWQVALELYEMIQFGTFYNVIMTRTSEADTNLPTNWTRNLWYRANKANYGDNGNPVDYFISIHHNGLEPVGTKGTEVFWTSVALTDSGYPRVYGYWRPADIDSLLAMKIHFRLLDLWHYPDLCSSACGGGSSSIYCCDNDYFVLRNTVMPSALSEASNLNDAVEESLFNDPETGHAEEEAFAIFDGWASHRDNMGIAIVKNGYSGGSEGKFIIADWLTCSDDDTVSSPYVRCWLMGELYCLKAITPQIINGTEYTFHHWAHLSPTGEQIGENWLDPVWPITVWQEWDYHRYVAYFTGGPYSAQVVSPNGGEIWHVGEQRWILWNVSIGADSTSAVDVFLDRNGGNTGYPEQLANNIWAGYGGFCWTVTGQVSAHCRIKIIAEDVADNSAWDTSTYDFCISETGNNNPVIDTGLHCKYPYTECNECINWGESFTLEVHAHDPDADSMYYEWHCGPPPFGGHFPNGQNVMTTAQNYVVYTAPTTGKQGEDYLSLAVNDVRGGQTWTTGRLRIYDQGTNCLCGDANDDGIISSGDIVFLISYLYKRGPAPYPYEKADVNNDCVVNSADITYLNNYLFKHGPLPECCWIHPISKLAEFP